MDFIREIRISTGKMRAQRKRKEEMKVSDQKIRLFFYEIQENWSEKFDFVLRHGMKRNF